MAKQAKTKRPAVSLVPQTREGAAAQLRRIGEVRRELARTEADMNDELAQVKEAWSTSAAPLQEELQALLGGLQAWCEANRDGIVAKGTKAADLGTGKVLWRLLPAKVNVRGVEAAIEACRRLGLLKFIRTKEELNKEAMREEPVLAATVPGISVGSAGEEFVVEPFEAELTEAAA